MIDNFLFFLINLMQDFNNIFLNKNKSTISSSLLFDDYSKCSHSDDFF